MTTMYALLHDWNTRFENGLPFFGFDKLKSYTPDLLCAVCNSITQNNPTYLNHDNNFNIKNLDSINDKISIEDENYYSAILLNSFTEKSQTISIGAGGIVYIDPFIALFSAVSVSLKPENPYVLPKAKNIEELLSIAKDMLSKEKINKTLFEQKMSASSGWIEEKPVFSLIAIKGSDLSNLIQNGFANVSILGRNTFVELFDKP